VIGHPKYSWEPLYLNEEINKNSFFSQKDEKNHLNNEELNNPRRSLT